MWIIPSRRRPESLRELFNSAARTGTCTPARVLVDQSDYKDNQSVYMELEREHAPKDWKFVVTTGESMGDKFRETEPWLWGPAPWVGILNDDHYIITDQWDRKLLAKLDGTNYVSCNDRWHAPRRLAGAVVYSGALVKCVGYMFPRKMQHIFHDCVWEEIGKATGCWQVELSVVVEHRHVMKGERASDSTHKKSYNSGRWFMEMEIFTAWQNEDREIAIQKVREFRKGKVGHDLFRTKKSRSVETPYRDPTDETGTRCL